MDAPVIFTESDTLTLKKLEKRIATARVFTLVPATICFLFSVLAIAILAKGDKNDSGSLIVLMLMGPLAVIYSLSAFLSKRYPVKCFIAAAAVTIILAIFIALGFFVFDRDYSLLPFCILTVLAAISAFIVRGLSAAEKHKKLLLSNI